MKKLLACALKCDSFIFVLSRIRDNSDRIKETAKSENEVFVQQDYHSPTAARRGKNMDAPYIFIALEIIKYVK
jgi:hypothetical protein